jgi:hypothetical protein
MQLSLKYDLPFTTITVAYNGSAKEIPNVLVDTGSGSSILSADLMMEIGILPSPDDTLYSICGVGGNEAVFARKVEYVQAGEIRISGFEIEVGGMDYGFEINGILGTDFFLQAGAVIDLKELRMEFADYPKGKGTP